MTEEKKYRFSQDFEKFLVKTCEGFITGERFERTYSIFELEAARHTFTKQSETNLIRIISSLFDRVTFLAEAPNYPHHAEILCAVASNSNYLTDIVVRHSEFLYLVFNEDFLRSELSEEKLQTELEDTVNRFKTTERKLKFTRIFKRKYLLKIGLNDILGNTELARTTSELSMLARVISKKLFELCYEEICSKNGIEADHKRYVLCSLGKLGGNELNYSSDIDLIIFYDKNETLVGKRREFHEIITDSVQLFVGRATDITEDTYIYRVDFRLRPDGRNSVLSRPMTDYLKYYETRGEEWERQMLIKLGFVAGSKSLFDQFKSYIDKFIYPASITGSIFEHVKRMKDSIESRLKDDHNIKLTRGGIRDIEFSVQALQLMSGGKNPEIKTGSTLVAIAKLHKFGLLKDKEKSVLTDSYILFRKTEHYLQLMNDKQTHSIPQSGDTAIKLPVYLGYNNFDEFTNELAGMKNQVRDIYESILGEDSKLNDDPYSNVGFTSEEKAKKDILFLAKGISLIGEKRFDSKTIKAFSEIENSLIDYLEKSSQPDIVIENFARVIKNTDFPSIWYNTFEDEIFFDSFLKIIEYSQKAVNILVTDEAMGDFLLTKSVFAEDPAAVSQDLTPKQFMFVLAVQQILDKLNPFELSEQLSRFVLNKLRSVINKTEPEYEYFIAGLGSFGNDEMNFSSDIDLIVVIDKPDFLPQAQKDFQSILSCIRQELKFFEVDFRLRPEGKSSPLVWDMNGYRKYFETRIQFWELQALSKMKFVSGNKNIYDDFAELTADKINRFSKEKIVRDVMEMYSKKVKSKSQIGSSVNLKNHAGTLITLDTLIHLNLFVRSRFTPAVINTGIKTRLEILPVEVKEEISRNYLFLKNLELTIQNLFDHQKPQFPIDKSKQELLAEKLKFQSGARLEEDLNKIIKTNVKLLNKWKT